MAIRNIVLEGDPLLNKVCRKVEKIDDRIIELLNDMKETMYEAEGVGLAGPQVGVLKRLFIIDVGTGLIEFINPEIIEKSGECFESEGCLSLPGVFGKVKRPAKVTVKATNRNGEEFTIENATGLLARAICHEYDHLDGILIREKIEEYDD